MDISRSTGPEIKVQVVAVGPRGPQGPRGPSGDGAESISYVHTQMTPSDEWVIEHSLDFFPGGIVVLDNAGTQHVGEVSYPDRNTLRIHFYAGGFSGTAYLS